MPHIHGTLVLPESWSPSDGTTISVVLEDVSRADAAATVLAETWLEPRSAASQQFSLSYDDSGLYPRARLSLRARATVDGRLVLTSTEHVPPPAQAEDTVQIRLEEVRSAPPGPAVDPLTGTWEVREIGGEQARPGMRGSALTVAFHGGAVTGFAGCNGFRGPSVRTDDGLVLGPLVSTRRMCVDGMEQEAALLAALARVAGFRRSGPLLHLLDAGGEIVVLLTIQVTPKPGTPTAR